MAQGEDAAVEYVMSILNSEDHPVGLAVKAAHNKYCKDHETLDHKCSFVIDKEEDDSNDKRDPEDMLLSLSDDQLAESMRHIYFIGVPDSFGSLGESLMGFLTNVKDLPNAEMAKKVRDFITTHQGKSVENDISEIPAETEIQFSSIGRNEDNANEKTDDAEI